MPEVKICDVTLRDGLQVLNRKAIIPMGLRLRLLEALEEAGLPYLEIGSFVSKRIIPAMADTITLIERMDPYPGGQIAVLVPKLSYYRMLAEDRERKVDTIALFLSASEEYSTANTNMSRDQAFAAAAELAAVARADGYRLRGYLSCAFRDVGLASREMDPVLVERECERMLEMGCEMVALSDTDGRATPRDLERVVGHLARRPGLEQLGAHLHDRFGQGIANALVAYQQGLRIFDSSVGGIGGTRAVKNSVGNIATEELVALFDGIGVETGVDLEPLIEAGRIVIEMTRLVGDPLPASKLLSHKLLRSDASGFINVPAAARIAVSALRETRPEAQLRSWTGIFAAVARSRVGAAAIASMLTMLFVLLTALLLTYVFSLFSIVPGERFGAGSGVRPAIIATVATAGVPPPSAEPRHER